MTKEEITKLQDENTKLRNMIRRLLHGAQPFACSPFEKTASDYEWLRDTYTEAERMVKEWD